jgi:ribosome-associated protein
MRDNPMLATEQKDLTIEKINEIKGDDIVCFEISNRSDIADFMVIANGRSSRHIESIAEFIVESFKNSGIDTVKVEGDKVSGWILLDTGDIIIHIMTPDTREFYALEKLWDQDHLTSMAN